MSAVLWSRQRILDEEFGEHTIDEAVLDVADETSRVGDDDNQKSWRRYSISKRRLRSCPLGREML